MKQSLQGSLNSRSQCVYFIYIGCFSLLLLSLASNWEPASAQSNSTAPTPAPLSSSSGIDQQSPLAIKLYEADMRAELYRQNFQRLEETAAELRRTRARFPGGAWKLHKFYQGVDMPASEEKAKGPEWAMHLTKLQKWIEAFPDSITAHVALGSAYVNYGWSARGRGFANKVSEEGWQLFQERLGTAKGILDKAGLLPEKCPHRQVTLETLAMGEGFGRDYLDQVFNEGVALEPGYHYLYTAKANYLLPRWHGNKGEMERFAEQTAQRVGGKEGSILYFLIAEDVGPRYRSDLFYDTTLSWPKIQQGFRDLESEYGMNDIHLNAYCRLAGWANDMTTSQQMLQRIGDRWDSSAWGTEENFEEFKAWAFTSSWKYRILQWSLPTIVVLAASLIVYRRVRRHQRSKQRLPQIG